MNLQDQYVSSYYGLDSESNAILLRGVLPHKLFDWPQILRATVPIVTSPDQPVDSTTGLGDPGPNFPPPDDEALEPATPPILLAVHRPPYRSGPMDEQLPEGAIAPLAAPSQQRLAARRVLPGHQAQPGRELAPVLE